MSAFAMKNTITLLLLFLGLATVQWPALSFVSGARESTTDLFRVKKIFFRTDSLRLWSTVRDALVHFGFVVVDTESDADAVMEGGNEFEWITLDGPQPDPG